MSVPWEKIRNLAGQIGKMLQGYLLEWNELSGVQIIIFAFFMAFVIWMGLF